MSAHSTSPALLDAAAMALDCLENARGESARAFAAERLREALQAALPCEFWLAAQPVADLLLAEIERLDRAAAPTQGEQQTPGAQADALPKVRELVECIKDAHSKWGGWSGTPGACDRVLELLAGAAAAPAQGESAAAVPAQAQPAALPVAWLRSDPRISLVYVTLTDEAARLPLGKHPLYAPSPAAQAPAVQAQQTDDSLGRTVMAFKRGADEAIAAAQAQPEPAAEPVAPDAQHSKRHGLFFTFDCDAGFRRHATAEDAKAWATEVLREERKHAQFEGEWNGNVEEVCWGEVREAAVAVDVLDDACDYKLLAAQPVAAVPAQAQREPLSDEHPYTYASTQATNCADCGKYKHTPLRIDAMGGYVCLTCIDRKLGTVLGEFGYPAAQEPLSLDDIGCMEVGAACVGLAWDARVAMVRATERAHGIGAAAPAQGEQQAPGGGHE